MGSSAADTEREITRLRGDMTDALAEAQRRLKGGMRSLAGAETRISSGRARDDVAIRAKQNPTLVGVGGMVVAGAIGYGLYSLVAGWRERQKPQNRLKRQVQQASHELGERLGERVEVSRRQLERAAQRNLLLKLDPEDGGYMRVVDARIENPARKGKGRQDVIKKLFWAGMLSVFMAVGAVLARRVAGTVWKAALHEDPPTEKSKAES
jgi:hypothetical protein